MNVKDVIRTQLEQAFRRKSWHGTNLLGSIRGIDVATAIWRPSPDRHNIQELIVHAAYWKYSVYRRLDGDRGLSFALPGSNWFERPDPLGEQTLASDIGILKTYHKLLLDSFEEFPEERLLEVPKGSATNFLDLVIGVAAHDLYHSGQIQMIKRMVGK